MLKKSIFGLVAAAFISSLVMSLPGCGGGGGGGTAAAAAPPAPPAVASFNVNSATGNDASAVLGTAPYKTITKAVQMASAVALTSGANINVASGVYNVASGEVFPIKPTKGENLIGTGNVQLVGAGAYKVAAGNMTAWNLPFVMAFASGVTGSMTGVSLSGSQETLCVDNATVTLTNNTLAGSTDIALWVADGAQLTLTGNTINNGNWGMLVADATTKVVARGNSILTPNVNGVVLGYTLPIPASAADLGTAASPGNNKILGSAVGGVGITQMSVTAGGTVQAVGNTWHPNIQGADAAGHYASAVIAAGTAVAPGNNYATQASAMQF